MVAAAANVDRNKLYELGEAVALVKGGAKSKFDETIEVAMNLGVDPRHADQMVRGVVALPNGSGKSVRVAVFAKDAKAAPRLNATSTMSTTASNGRRVVAPPVVHPDSTLATGKALQHIASTASANSTPNRSSARS